MWEGGIRGFYNNNNDNRFVVLENYKVWKCSSWILLIIACRLNRLGHPQNFIHLWGASNLSSFGTINLCGGLGLNEHNFIPAQKKNYGFHATNFCEEIRSSFISGRIAGWRSCCTKPTTGCCRLQLTNHKILLREKKRCVGRGRILKSHYIS